jgi:hypothetical protein
MNKPRKTRYPKRVSTPEQRQARRIKKLLRQHEEAERIKQIAREGDENDIQVDRVFRGWKPTPST